MAFAAGPPDAESGIYLGREGRRAHRVLGSDGGRASLACPAFSPGGDRLVAGQAVGSDDTGWRDAALVITDLTTGGRPLDTYSLALEGVTEQPCASWSSDGRWLAFLAGTHDAVRGYLPRYSEVWVVDTRTKDVRRLKGLGATDIGWAPRGPELFIASHGIRVYSAATAKTRFVDHTSKVVAFALSPDGRSLAAEQDSNADSDGPSALVVMRADGSERRTLVAGYDVSHGIGPVWSPDGSRVAIQRLCDSWVDESGRNRTCYEQHEVVVVTVNDRDPGSSPTATVVGLPRTTEHGVSTVWAPFCVSWSPDSSTLLYVAWSSDRTGVLAVPVDTARPPAIIEDALDVDSDGSAWNWAEQRK